MNSVLAIHNGTKYPDYIVFCANCGFEYQSDDDTHFCIERGYVLNIDDERVQNELR